MNDITPLRGSEADDHVLRASAVAATARHHGDVLPHETAAALASVRARVATGETSGVHTARSASQRAADRWRPWAVAAALVTLVGGGALALALRSDGSNTVVPATDATTGPTTNTTEPTTTPTTSVTPTTTAGASTTVTAPAGSIAQPSIPHDCVGTDTCTQLIGTADGRIVAYSPTDEALVVYDGNGSQELQRVPLVEPLAGDYPTLLVVGPDDVVYFLTATPGATDPSNDLVAVPLAGQAAGTVVQRWTGLDGSGDSTLVPQADGLVVVGCCGQMETRPTADAQRYPYVDRAGETVTSIATTFRLDLTPGGGNLVRIDGGVETVFPLPSEFQAPRDFPRTIATADGGALAVDWVELPEGGTMCIARFVPAAGENPARADVFKIGLTQVALAEASGTVLVADGDHFTRLRLDDLEAIAVPAG